MKKLILIVLFSILLYTRFVNLSWGLPYPFHPDERNMASAIEQFGCTFATNGQAFTLTECMNPHFFAYGQFPLYAANLLAWVSRIFTWQSGPIHFVEAVISLRIVSALTSFFTVIVLWKLINLFLVKPRDILVLSLLTFVPVFIQFSHFGTTESMLMLFCSVLLYLSIRILKKEGSPTVSLLCAAIISGLALGTKISSAAFIPLPLIAYLWSHNTKEWKMFFMQVVQYGAYALIFFILSSPHNFISFKEFLSSMRYESDVALGNVIPFYTRQFLDKPSIIFQSVKIFPYTLGWPFFGMSLFGLLFLPWKDKRLLFLRFAFILTFFPSAFFYAKWTRFLAPVFPIMMLFAVLGVTHMYSFFIRRFKTEKGMKLVLVLGTIACIVPGIAYLSIYQNRDVRFTASSWIYKEVPSESYILTETANVVDIPIPDPDAIDNPKVTHSYPLNSFNYYELDNEPQLPAELGQALSLADYITIPSRRVFYNHTCYRDKDGVIQEEMRADQTCKKLEILYPNLNIYYDDLFDGSLGFSRVAKFTSYPRLQLFGKTIIEFPDEDAEETWTVFDHPVIRIYKRT